MICKDCRQRADMNKGCDTACPVGCDCQHRARRYEKQDDAKMGESVEG